ncbi:hypothetical protein O4G98_16355 [Zoogloeaceae bacterium G21618-S1]|nr:hypothetical protein [Zoogloeaceae bacterium G21618-S1]
MRCPVIRRYAVLCCLPATAWAATASVDWLAQVAMGLGEGLRRVVVAVWQWVGHPWLTADGIALAFSDRRHGLAAWQAATTHAWAGLSADPAGTVGTIAMWAVCAAGSVLVAGGLTGIGARIWRVLSRPGSKPRRRDRVGRLWRARAMREERRRGEVGARWWGWSRVGHGLEDLRDTPRVLHRYGLAGAAFLLGRLRRAVARVVVGGVCQLAQQFAYVAVPLALLAAPWIDLGVQRDATARQAEQTLVPEARRFLAAVPGSAASLVVMQANTLRQHYAAHRQRLLAPIERLDWRLDADLNALDALVSAGPVASEMLDHRLDGAFKRFASYRLRWVGVLVWPVSDGEADPLAVPRTWFESRAIERSVFARAHEQAAAAVRTALDALLTTLDAEWDYDMCLRSWDPTLLVKRPWSVEDAADAERACGRRP